MSLKSYFSIASNTLFQVFSRVVTASITLITTPLITAAFGRAGYGEYQMILTYTTLFWILTDFGLNAVVVREMAAAEDKLQTFFSALFSLRTILGGSLTFLAVSILVFLSYPAIVKLGIIIGSTTILWQGLMGAPHAVFQLKLRYDRLLAATVVGGVVQLVLILLVVRLNLGILGLASAFTVGYVAAALASLIFVKEWVELIFGWSRNFLLPLVRQSLPFGLALLLSLAAFKIDAILLSVLPLPFWKNSEAVAVYSLPYRIFELALAAPTFFMNAVYPILVKQLHYDRVLFIQTVKKIWVALAIGSVFGLAATWALAPFAIHLLAKTSGFEFSVSILRILILSCPVFFLSSLLMWLLVIFQKQLDLIKVYGAAFLFNFVANFIFIPRFSFWAAAWITGATEVLILILLMIFTASAWRENLSFRTRRE